MAAPVLLVHDDIAVIAAVRRLLTRRGHEVLLATSVADAVTSLSQARSELVVLAPGAEDGAGASLLHELQRRPEWLPLRVLLMEMPVPGLSLPVVPLPLDGGLFQELITKVLSEPPNFAAAAAPQETPAPVPSAAEDELDALERDVLEEAARRRKARQAARTADESAETVSAPAASWLAAPDESRRPTPKPSPPRAAPAPMTAKVPSTVAKAVDPGSDWLAPPEARLPAPVVQGAVTPPAPASGRAPPVAPAKESTWSRAGPGSSLIAPSDPLDEDWDGFDSEPPPDGTYEEIVPDVAGSTQAPAQTPLSAYARERTGSEREAREAAAAQLEARGYSPADDQDWGQQEAGGQDGNGLVPAEQEGRGDGADDERVAGARAAMRERDSFLSEEGDAEATSGREGDTAAAEWQTAREEAASEHDDAAFAEDEHVAAEAVTSEQDGAAFTEDEQDAPEVAVGVQDDDVLAAREHRASASSEDARAAAAEVGASVRQPSAQGPKTVAPSGSEVHVDSDTLDAAQDSTQDAAAREGWFDEPPSSGQGNEKLEEVVVEDASADASAELPRTRAIAEEIDVDDVQDGVPAEDLEPPTLLPSGARRIDLTLSSGALFRMPEQGRTDILGLTQLVVNLAGAPGGFGLRLASATAARTLWIRDARLVGASSSAPGESIVEQARRDGLIDGRQEAELRPLATTPIATAELVKVLRERRYLRELEVLPLVQRNTEHVALEALSEEETQYTFISGVPPADVYSIVAGRPLLAIIADALRRHITAEIAAEQLGGLDAVPTLQRFPIEPSALGFSEREGALLRAIDGDATIEGLLRECSVPQEAAMKALVIASMLGLVAVRRPPPGLRTRLDPDAGELDIRRLQAKFEEMQEADYFSILGLPRSASNTEVERAFERLTSEFHPLKFAALMDANVQRRAEQIQELLAEAADALRSDRLRSEYARSLRD